MDKSNVQINHIDNIFDSQTIVIFDLNLHKIGR
jgi:hypothetical protein